MGWKGAVRSMGAAVRAAERESQRRQREAERYNKLLAKQVALDEAAHEVEEFNDYIARLISLHQCCSESVDWHQIAESTEPTAPALARTAEAKAHRALSSYKPGLIDRLFKREQKKRSKLQAALDAAIANDRMRHVEAMGRFNLALTKWQTEKSLADRVLSGDADARRYAIQHLGLFKGIAELGSKVEFEISEQPFIAAKLRVHDEQVIPAERKTLLQSGKLSIKKFPKGEYWELYQDHVCSAALRIAGELFAAIPVDLVIVTAVDRLLNPATGHLEEQALLSIAVPRTTFEMLKLESIDPSAAMKNFVHRMKFQKTKGFSPVEPINLADMEDILSETH